MLHIKRNGTVQVDPGTQKGMVTDTLNKHTRMVKGHTDMVTGTLEGTTERVTEIGMVMVTGTLMVTGTHTDTTTPGIHTTANTTTTSTYTTTIIVWGLRWCSNAHHPLTVCNGCSNTHHH